MWVQSKLARKLERENAKLRRDLAALAVDKTIPADGLRNAIVGLLRSNA